MPPDLSGKMDGQRKRTSDRQPEFVVAIPARLKSQRLPEKLLQPLDGRPLIHYTVERALESGALTVVVATDAAEIAESVQGLGCEVCMTAASHDSGTDRLAECAQIKAWPDETIVVNLQGDEPLLPGKWLQKTARDLVTDNAADIATLCNPIESRRQVFDPNVVKVVLDKRGYAMYFSRAPIPWSRASFAENRRELPTSPAWHRHIGVYAYRVSMLRTLVKLQKTPAESSESLEQLRALEHGYSIYVSVIEGRTPPGVDTREDLEKIASILQHRDN